ncbi:hypothetical protein [Aminobacter sp. SS-2016]|uniref:hypothetical protein n=1 Tax=Aminobacter sp. Y103A TaxID=1870862 RepID=UPI0025737EBA|nr:hypothetical protein [Aminobacter sp. SS-2016]
MLLLITCVVAGAGIAYATTRIVHPTEFAYSAILSDSLDYQSPTQRVIIEMFSPGIPEQFWKYCPRGDFQLRAAVWRDVSLCQRDAMSDADFDVRNSYFRTRVDDDYSRFYWTTTEVVGKGVLAGFAAWAFALLLFGAYKWVMRAPAHTAS